MAIVKALENIQYSKAGEDSPSIYESRVNPEDIHISYNKSGPSI